MQHLVVHLEVQHGGGILLDFEVEDEALGSKIGVNSTEVSICYTLKLFIATHS